MVLHLKSVADNLVMSKIRKAQQELPFFTFQKLCFAFLHNDWIMIISSLLTLTATLSQFLVESPLHFFRSES